MPSAEHLQATAFCPGDLISTPHGANLFPMQSSGERVCELEVGEFALIVAVYYEFNPQWSHHETQIADLFVISQRGAGWIRRQTVYELIREFTVVVEADD